jgi:hypothetical protein
MGTDLIHQEKRCAYRSVHLHLQKGHPLLSSPSQNPSRHGKKREREVEVEGMRDGRANGKKNDVNGVW